MAIAHFRKALDLNPEYPDAWHNAGVVLEKTGRKAEAQPYYARARALGLTR